MSPSSDRRPRSTSRIASVAVKLLLIDPAMNAVAGVTGAQVAVSRRP